MGFFLVVAEIVRRLSEAWNSFIFLVRGVCVCPLGVRFVCLVLLSFGF